MGTPGLDAEIRDTPLFNRNTQKTAIADLVRTVIRELQLQAQVLAAQQGNNGLQLVAVFAAYPHSIALNAYLRLLFRVLYQPDDLFGLFRGDALLQADLLPHALAGRRLKLSIGEILERHAAL